MGKFVRAVSCACAWAFLSGSSPGSTPDFPTLYAAAYKSMQREFGDLRGSYFIRGGRISYQVALGLGFSDDMTPLSDGNYFVSGWRPHSAQEKSAVVMKLNGSVLAAGMITDAPSCELSKRATCYARQLTIFVKARNNKPAILKPIYDWGRSFSHFRVTIFDKVIVPETPRRRR